MCLSGEGELEEDSNNGNGWRKARSRLVSAIPAGSAGNPLARFFATLVF